MKFMERMRGALSSPEPSEEEKAFQRRATLRKGGPEADTIRQEEHESSLEQAQEQDRQRKEQFIKEWPKKREGLEKQIKSIQEDLAKYERQQNELEASRVKNDERQFAMQSRTDSKNEKQVRALKELRDLRDLAARNKELVIGEQGKIKERITLLQSDLESGDRRFESSNQDAK